MAKTLKDDWEFNVLGVYNYRKPGPLQYYFDYVIERHAHVPGDLLEAGVFKGRSLIAMGLLLKELGSNKKLFGYDSWSGFPPVYDEADQSFQWERLHQQGRIGDEHLAKVRLNQQYRGFSLQTAKELTAANLSLSGDFSKCSRAEVQAKLDFLGLDNVQLIEGPFHETMRAENAPTEALMAVLIDADLHQSYWSTLNLAWPRLSPGGYVFLDEYYSLKFPGARIATDAFFADKKEKPYRHKIIEGDFERWGVLKLGG